MKKLLIISFLISVYVTTAAQVKTNCCISSATDAFAMNAGNKSFVMQHDEPLPFKYKSKAGNEITFKTTDGKDAHAWMVKSDKQTDYYMFVIHEWWGLNDYVKQQSEKLANDLGLNVIALDLYDNQVATTQEDASNYMKSVTTERAMAIIHGAYTFVGNQAKVFTIGWCFGGGWSLQTAIEGGKQVVGCIMFYGQPETDVNRLKHLNADVIGFFGKKDEWINENLVNDFKVNMQKADKKLTAYSYDADHAFANPSNPKFDKVSTTDAYEKAYAFVRERMK